MDGIQAASPRDKQTFLSYELQITLSIDGSNELFLFDQDTDLLRLPRTASLIQFRRYH
jgi:hypothetical protein